MVIRIKDRDSFFNWAALLVLVAALLFAYNDLRRQKQNAELVPDEATVASLAQRSMPKVELYTRQSCPFCQRAKKYLRLRGIPFSEYDTEKNRAAKRKKERLVEPKVVPVAVIGETTIVGFRKEAFDKAFGIGH